MKRLKGIFTDTEPIDQPEGTYRDARNIEVNKSLGAVVSERGNLEVQDINGEILGSLLLPSGNTLLFIRDGNFKIIEINESDFTLTTHLNINLTVGNYVQATFNINSQGQTVVYWVDGLNPPYFTVLGSNSYKTLFPQLTSFATFSNAITTPTGGNLKSGAYYFALAYVDGEGNRTNFFNVSNPVVVTSGPNRGVEGGIPTSSSISLEISGIDTEYKKLRIVVIPQYQNVIGEVLQLPDIEIVSNNIQYIYNGSESTTVSSLNEVIIDFKEYSTAKTITTAEGRLYLGNLTSEEEIDYQKYAKNITIKCVRKENEYTPLQSPSYKTFKGDEVYAFYIAWVMKNGSMSKAFHIPGRAPKDLPAITGNTSEHKIVITKDVNTDAGNDFVLDITVDSAYVASSNFSMDFRLQSPDETLITNTIFIPVNSTASSVLADLKTSIEGLGFGFSGSITSNTLTITSTSFAGNLWNAFLQPVSQVGSGDFRDGESLPPAGYTNLEGVTTFNFVSYLTTPESTQAIITLILPENNLNVPFVSPVVIEAKRNETAEAVYDKIISAINPAIYSATKVNSNTELVITSLAQKSIYNGLSVIYSHIDQSLAFDLNLTTIRLGNEAVSSSGETSSGTIFSKVYQERSIPDSDFNMGYWENTNEFYPNNSTVWGSLAGQKVRHHKFPDASDPNYRHFDSDKMVQFGIKLENIEVPSEIKDKVLGYKVYYAKRDGNNRTILDTSVAHPTLRVLDADNLTTRTANANWWNSNNSSVQIQSTYPFNLLRTKQPISGISHVKVIGQLFNNVEPTITQDDVKIKPTKITTLFSVNNEIKPLLAKSYVDFNKEDTIVTLEQFTPATFVMNRTESRLLIQTGIDNVRSNKIELINFLTPKDNIYNSFENQFLVDIGYYKKVEPSDTIIDSDDLYNGDTFVCEFIYKNTHSRNTEYLVQINTTVITSDDDINLRTEGRDLWQRSPRRLAFTQFGAPRWTPEGNFRFKWANASRDGLEAVNNYIEYNEDYSAKNIIKPAFVYNRDFFRTDFSTRIIRNVESSLTFRNFRPDDFIDLTGNRGELIKLSNYNNILIPHLSRALVRTRGQEELQVDDIRAFLGSGDIFSVRPDELIYTEEGFGGIQSINHSITTPFGYFFIDKQARKVYRLDNDGINEINNNGLYKYFYDNIPSYTDIKWGYDPQVKRIMLSTNTDTLSFYPEFNAWMSFHDYNPDYLFRTYDTFFTTKNNKLYKHNVDTSYTVYGSLLDMVYSFVDNTSAAVSKIVDSVTIIGEVKNANGQQNRIINTIKLSNSYQETDTINIVNNNNFDYINTTRKTKNEWNINKFRQASSITGQYSWAYKKRIEDKFVKVDMTFTSNTDRIYIYGIIVNFKPSIR